MSSVAYLYKYIYVMNSITFCSVICIVVLSFCISDCFCFLGHDTELTAFTNLGLLRQFTNATVYR